MDIRERIAKQRFWVSLFLPLLSILLIWLVHFVAWGSEGGSLFWLGIYPRTFAGLAGVVLSPFLHSGWEHALSNTIALLLFGVALFYFYPREAWRVFFIGWLLSGLLTWMIGRSAYHIGASGLIYAVGTFLFFRGWRVRRRGLAALSLVLTFLYGSMFWGIFPADVSISWEGHFAGAVVGSSLAYLLPLYAENEALAFGSDSAFDYSTITHTGRRAWRLQYRRLGGQ